MRKLRESLDVTRYELAPRAGLREQTIAGAEEEGTDPRTSTTIKILKGLGYTAAQAGKILYEEVD